MTRLTENLYKQIRFVLRFAVECLHVCKHPNGILAIFRLAHNVDGSKKMLLAIIGSEEVRVILSPQSLM